MGFIYQSARCVDERLASFIMTVSSRLFLRLLALFNEKTSVFQQPAAEYFATHREVRCSMLLGVRSRAYWGDLTARGPHNPRNTVMPNRVVCGEITDSYCSSSSGAAGKTNGAALSGRLTPVPSY